MTPKIDNPTQIVLSAEARAVIIELFANYKRVIVHQTFTDGLSGGQVVKVQGIRKNGIGELPAAVKIAPLSQIEREWEAYEAHIRNRLYYVAHLTADPVKLEEIGWGGLRYALMGGEKFETTTLLDYLARDEVSPEDALTVLDYLLRTMYDLWAQNMPKRRFSYGGSYDPLLPVHYRIQYLPTDKTNLPVLGTHAWPTTPLKLGELVRVVGFVVHKVNLETQTMTLRDPNTCVPGHGPLIRLWFPNTEMIKSYKLNQPITNFSGIIVETRQSRLVNEVREIFDSRIVPLAPQVSPSETSHIQLDNPLLAYSDVLNHRCQVKVASIHGDFNLANILVEPERQLISLIDFSEARTDHVLHDLLRLEREIITRLLPKVIAAEAAMPAISLLAYFYEQLDGVTDQTALTPPPFLPASLKKCWVILSKIRQEARYYFLRSEDNMEYYRGLFVYLLGALKFKNLEKETGSKWPKQLAFWGAAFAYQYLTQPQAVCKQVMTAIAQPFLHRQPSSTPVKQNKRPIPASKNGLSKVPLTHLPAHGAILPVGSRMPFGRNPTFTGRDTDLIAIARQFRASTSSSIVAVAGMGGLGKTQLANEFVYRYGSFFPGGVFWLSFSEAANVPIEIAACGGTRFMNVRPDFAELSLKEQVDIVLEAWQTPVPRLLIFDNCEDPALLAEWLPQINNCYVLVTSRRTQWPDLPYVHALQPLRRSDSLFLLRRYYRDEDDAVLGALAHEVGDLPLALHIIGSYLKQNQGVVSPNDYLLQLRQQPFQGRLLQNDYEGGRITSSYQQSVERTFALSYEQLDPERVIDRCALAILSQAACLAPGEPIETRLVEVLLAADDAVARCHLQESIQRLLSLGLLLTDDSEQATIRLHRLVLDFVRHRRSEEMRLVQEGVETAVLQTMETLVHTGQVIQLQNWQGHLRAVVVAAQEGGQERGAQLGELLAEYLSEIGDYQQSEPYLLQSVAICEQLFGPSHPITAHYLARLGYLLDQLEKWEQGWEVLQKALAIQEATLSARDPETAVTLNYLGFFLQNKNELGEAWGYHTRALRIRKHAFGLHNPKTAQSLINLAFIHYSRNQLFKAKTNLEKALTIYQEFYGLHHPKTISVMQYLGQLAEKQQDSNAARRIYLEVLNIRRKTLPDGHPEVARTLDLIGILELQRGNASRAEICLQNALDIRLRTLGNTSLLTAQSYLHLGMCFLEQGEERKASESYVQALEIYQLRLGDTAPQTLEAQAEIDRLGFKRTV